MIEFFKQMDPTLRDTFGLLFAVLLVASTVVKLLSRAKPDKNFKELTDRVKTWWVIVILAAAVIFSGRLVSILFFMFVSYLALKEYFSLVSTRRADRRVLFWAYLSIPLQYYWIHKGWYGMFVIFIPVYVFLLLPIRMILIGKTDNFLTALSRIHWGVMTTVYCVSHAAYLLVLDPTPLKNSSPATLLLFLLILSQFNDVFQYLWGKAFGRSKVVPTVSPNKTFEGFVGGVLSTLALAYMIAPHLTPLTTKQSLVAGAIIAVGGFVGDVTISAIKRDIGAKDSGHLLPGHGGILDRIDSLFYTAPLFFHYIFYTLYPPLFS